MQFEDLYNLYKKYQNIENTFTQTTLPKTKIESLKQ